MRKDVNFWTVVFILIIAVFMIILGISKLWASQTTFHDWKCSVGLIECRKVSQ